MSLKRLWRSKWGFQFPNNGQQNMREGGASAPTLRNLGFDNGEWPVKIPSNMVRWAGEAALCEL